MMASGGNGGGEAEMIGARAFVAIAITLGVMTAISLPAAAQPYPSRPVWEH
jgi:hypothetical protein